jgi:hypothetical protein
MTDAWCTVTVTAIKVYRAGDRDVADGADVIRFLSRCCANYIHSFDGLVKHRA